MGRELELYNGKPLAEQVAEHILNDIVKNNLEIGAKIPNEFELAERIGVGRSTIREAIKILVSNNVLEIRQGINHMEEDIILHKVIAGCSGNIVVEKLIPIINSWIAVFIDGDETIQTHREIINAISERDAEGAKCDMNMHLIYNRRAMKHGNSCQCNYI